MNIKILDAKKETYWYSRFIGSVFEVTGKDSPAGYFVRHDGFDQQYVVDKADCRPTTKGTRKTEKRSTGAVAHTTGAMLKCPHCGKEIRIVGTSA